MGEPPGPHAWRRAAPIARTSRSEGRGTAGLAGSSAAEEALGRDLSAARWRTGPGVNIATMRSEPARMDDGRPRFRSARRVSPVESAHGGRGAESAVARARTLFSRLRFVRGYQRPAGGRTPRPWASVVAGRALRHRDAGDARHAWSCGSAWRAGGGRHRRAGGPGANRRERSSCQINDREWWHHRRGKRN